MIAMEVFQIETSIKAIVICTMIFSSYNTGVMGVLTLSPSMIAPVCHVGDRLKVTCSTTVASFLRWRISVLDKQLQDRSIERNINSDDVGVQSSSITVNSTLFNFTRASTQGVSPLVSTLTVINVTNNLNGTRVHCVEVDRSMSADFTTIIVIETGHNNVNCSVKITREHYGADDVQVSVKLAQRKYMTCNASILPHVPMNFNGSTSFHVTLQYNMKYNLNVEGKALYRENRITHMELHYVNCGYPLPSTESVLKVTGYKGPRALEGTIVNFYCSSGMVLIGNKSATCTIHGQWMPDPINLICDESYCGNPLSAAANDSSVIAYSDLPNTVYFSCPSELVLTGPNTTTCGNNSQWEPDPSKLMCTKPEGSTDVIDINVTIAVMTSSVGAVFVCISVIIISCGCRRYFSQRMKRLRQPRLTCRTTIYTRQPYSRPPNHPTPSYENVPPKSQEQKFKLRPNAAYHPHAINKV